MTTAFQTITDPTDPSEIARKRLADALASGAGQDFGAPPPGSTDDLENQVGPRDFSASQPPKNFTPAPVNYDSPRAQELQSQADAIPATGIQPVRNWKDALFRAATQILPVALAGRFGGLAAGAGAAKGTLNAQNELASDALNRRADLIKQAETERNRQFELGKQEREFQIQEPFREAQADYYRERGAAASENRNQAAPTQDTGNGIMQWNPATRRYDIPVGPSKPKGSDKPDSPEQQFTDEYQRTHPGGSIADAQRAFELNKKIPNDNNEGTWALEEDPDGKPVLFNSKTGQSRPAPAGVLPKGTKAKADAANAKNIAPAQAAQQYATDYLNRGTYTGTGDEALMEKFFELAKPETGFRMTQPQQDMLKNSQSWVGSAQAKIRHATTGTWFSDTQRKQIVQTMNDLANAKIAAKSGNAGSAGGGKPFSGATKTYQGVTYNQQPDGSWKRAQAQ